MEHTHTLKEKAGRIFNFFGILEDEFNDIYQGYQEFLEEHFEEEDREKHQNNVGTFTVYLREDIMKMREERGINE